jgi:predicted RNA-binding Zn-ribbon protein involved in translation (DUF1610 family)
MCTMGPCWCDDEGGRPEYVGVLSCNSLMVVKPCDGKYACPDCGHVVTVKEMRKIYLAQKKETP